jgi:hypothetical protein
MCVNLEHTLQNTALQQFSFGSLLLNERLRLSVAARWAIAKSEAKGRTRASRDREAPRYERAPLSKDLVSHRTVTQCCGPAEQQFNHL